MIVRDLLRDPPDNYYLQTKLKLEEIYSNSAMWADINNQHEGLQVKIIQI